MPAPAAAKNSIKGLSSYPAGKSFSLWLWCDALYFVFLFFALPLAHVSFSPLANCQARWRWWRRPRWVTVFCAQVDEATQGGSDTTFHTSDWIRKLLRWAGLARKKKTYAGREFRLSEGNNWFMQLLRKIRFNYEEGLFQHSFFRFDFEKKNNRHVFDAFSNEFWTIAFEKHVLVSI